MSNAKPGFVSTQYDLIVGEVDLSAPGWVQIVPPDPRRWTITLGVLDTVGGAITLRPILPAAASFSGFNAFDGFINVFNFRDHPVLTICGWEANAAGTGKAYALCEIWIRG